MSTSTFGSVVNDRCRLKRVWLVAARRTFNQTVFIITAICQSLALNTTGDDVDYTVNMSKTACRCQATFLT